MCSNETSFFDSDEFYLTALHILTAIEVPIHLFGAFIIIAKTPQKMSSVKKNMLTLHSLSAFLDFYLSFLTSPVFTLPASAGYPLGLSLWIELPTSIQVYLGFSFVSAVSVSVVLLFEERFFVLTNGANTKRNWLRKMNIIILYFLSFTFFLPSFLNIPDQGDGRLDLLKNIHCFPPDILNRPGFFILAVDSTISVICVTCMASFLMIQGLVFAISIAWQLFHTSSKSKTIIKMQKQLMLALGIQVILPISVLFVPTSILVFLVWENRYNPAATNIAIVIVALHGMVSTITMIIVHPPYRDATLVISHRLGFTKQNHRKNRSKIWVTVAGQHVLKSQVS